MELSGKVALVTGGAVRVGRAIALAFAEAGCDIVLNYHSSADAAQATAADIRARGRVALVVQADIGQADQVARLVAAAIEGFGRLDVLVNSGSLWRRTPWKSLDERAWDELIDVNLKGAFLCSRAASKALQAHGDGAIVNIVDLSVFEPFPDFLPHSVAKAGLLNLTYALAIELAPSVRVNAIAPGLVLPPPGSSQERVSRLAQRNLLGRWGSAEDVAQAAVFLARAPFIDGVVLPVDGGERLRRT